MSEYSMRSEEDYIKFRDELLEKLGRNKQLIHIESTKYKTSSVCGLDSIFKFLYDKDSV